MRLISSLFSVWLAIASVSFAASAGLPTVDLGYEIHQALVYNVRFFNSITESVSFLPTDICLTDYRPIL